MPTFGTYTDLRDGTVYTTVLMPDGKWWSAENLAYASAGSKYPNNSAGNAPVYGRLYTNADGIASVPAGCHVPTAVEWDAMVTSLGLANDTAVGTALRATSFSGTDTFGFSVVAAGQMIGSSPDSFGSISIIGFSSYYSGSTAMPYIAMISAGSHSRTYGTASNYYSIRFIVDAGSVLLSVGDAGTYKSVSTTWLRHNGAWIAPTAYVGHNGAWLPFQ